jgi:hypothetical protein
LASPAGLIAEPPPDNLHNLVVATLEFLSARTDEPRVVEYHRNTEKELRLMSPRPISERTRLRRPIDFHRLIDFEMPCGCLVST